MLCALRRRALQANHGTSVSRGFVLARFMFQESVRAVVGLHALNLSAI